LSDVQIHSRNLANRVIGVVIQVAAVLRVSRVLDEEEPCAVDIVKTTLLACVQSDDACLNVALKTCRAVTLLLQEVVCAWRCYKE